MGAVANEFSRDLDSKLCYQIPLASLYAIPFCLSVMTFFVPESPRWLLNQGRSEEARQSLLILRGSSFKDHPELFEEEFLEMKQGIEHEHELATASSFRDMFKGTDRRRTFLCWAVVLSHSSSGISLIVAYGVCAIPHVYEFRILTGADILLPDGWCQSTFLGYRYEVLHGSCGCRNRHLPVI